MEIKSMVRLFVRYEFSSTEFNLAENFTHWCFYCEFWHVGVSWFMSEIAELDAGVDLKLKWKKILLRKKILLGKKIY